MSTWILILTIVQANGSGGSAIHSVPGFTDKASCMVAGDAWMKSASAPWPKIVANCVEQKK